MGKCCVLILILSNLQALPILDDFIVHNITLHRSVPDGSAAVEHWIHADPVVCDPAAPAPKLRKRLLTRTTARKFDQVIISHIRSVRITSLVEMKLLHFLQGEAGWGVGEEMKLPMGNSFYT